MTARAPFTKRDIERAVAGALAGGLEPGAFSIEVTPDGRLRILPLRSEGEQAAADLDDELSAWRATHGQG